MAPLFSAAQPGVLLTCGSRGSWSGSASAGSWEHSRARLVASAAAAEASCRPAPTRHESAERASRCRGAPGAARQVHLTSMLAARRAALPRGRLLGCQVVNQYAPAGSSGAGGDRTLLRWQSRGDGPAGACAGRAASEFEVQPSEQT
jgi:hypothetical protein